MRCRGAINSAGLSSIISPSCSVHPRRNSVGKEEVSLPPSLPRCLSWEKGGSRGRNLAAGEKSEKLTARVTLTQPLLSLPPRTQDRKEGLFIIQELPEQGREKGGGETSSFPYSSDPPLLLLLASILSQAGGGSLHLVVCAAGNER